MSILNNLFTRANSLLFNIIKTYFIKKDGLFLLHYKKTIFHVIYISVGQNIHFFKQFLLERHLHLNAQF